MAFIPRCLGQACHSNIHEDFTGSGIGRNSEPEPKATLGHPDNQRPHVEKPCILDVVETK
jgi:hypothetical protein